MSGNSKPRVMRIIARLNVGGPARHVVWLTSRLSDRFERVLLTGRVEGNEKEMTAFYRNEGVIPIYIDRLGRSIGHGDAAALKAILKEMRDFKPDIVHTHTSKAGMLGRVAAGWLNLTSRRDNPIKIIHTFHGHVLHGYFSAPVTIFFRNVERLLGRIASDRIIAISPQQLEEIAGRYKIAPRDKFRMIRIGIDLEPFNYRERSLDGEEIRIGFVGRLTAIKDPGLLLEAIQIARQVNPRIRLVVAGDGELRGEMEANAPEKTLFLGNQNDIPKLMDSLDMLVISSKNEGTPVSVLEAFAAGVPVASTRAGGAVDLLADDRGLLSDIGHAEGLAASILRFTSDPDLAKKCAHNARTYVEEKYSLPVLLQNIENLYDSL